MTQVKILTEYSTEILEKSINKFLKNDNLFITSVLDIKIQELTNNGNEKCISATIIYETNRIL